MTRKTKLYQIRIFRKGTIDIYERVAGHKIHTKEHHPDNVTISTVDAKGNLTHHNPRWRDAYDFQIIDNPEYEYQDSKPKKPRITFH
jgi:hypothetical protein